MRSLFWVAAIFGMVGTFHAAPGFAGTLDGTQVREPASVEKFSVAQADVRPQAASEAEAATSDRCGAPHVFEKRAVAADALRAKAAFAMDVLSTVPSNSPNVSISPFGLSAVLSTLDLGASASMRKAIASTLRLKASGGKIEELRRESRLINVAGQRTSRRFVSFSGIFVDHRLSLKPGVANIAKAEGEVDLQAIDFASKQGVDGVNQLLENNTNGRIKSILEPGSAPLLVVANAFVFKDCWKAPFDKSTTTNKAFTRANGTKIETPTMSLVSDTIGYRASGRFVAVELPYLDEDFALTLVTTQRKPATILGFRGAVPLIAGPEFSEARVTLSLPKFGGSTDNDLLEVLSAMGLASGLTSTNQLPGFADGVALGRLRQKIWLAVDETGTEAAAVTAAEATRSAIEPKSVTVNFDKPFIYALRYRPTGTILLAGYVGDPRENQAGR
jgi:serpin B